VNRIPLKQRQGAFYERRKHVNFGRKGMQEKAFRNMQKRHRAEIHRMMMSWR